MKKKEKLKSTESQPTINSPFETLVSNVYVNGFEPMFPTIFGYTTKTTDRATNKHVDNKDFDTKQSKHAGDICDMKDLLGNILHEWDR